MEEGDLIVEPDVIVREPGLVDLFGQLAVDARDVARAEAGLVKARAIDTLGRYKAAAILFAAAGTLGGAVLVALLIGLILTLSPYVGPGPATLIVVGVFGLIAVILGLLGKARLTAAKPDE